MALSFLEYKYEHMNITLFMNYDANNLSEK